MLGLAIKNQSKHPVFPCFNSFVVPLAVVLPAGIMDSQAECRKKSVFNWPSARNKLFPWEELLGGKLSKKTHLKVTACKC